MITFDVKSKQGVFKMSLPTSINEISKSYIDSVTSHVKVDANYTLIGIVFKEKLSTLILNTRKKTNKADVAVIPIFIKAGENDSKFINSLHICDKLVISPSDIMMGYHISSPRNVLTINNVLDVIDGDSDIFNKSLSIKEECYFIEFKLVPNCNIHGAYSIPTNNIENPFIIKLGDNKNSNLIIPNNSKVIV